MSSWADRGVSAEGLRITAFAPAIPGPIFCAARLRGSLKGVIAAIAQWFAGVFFAVPVTS